MVDIERCTLNVERCNVERRVVDVGWWTLNVERCNVERCNVERWVVNTEHEL